MLTFYNYFFNNYNYQYINLNLINYSFYLLFNIHCDILFSYENFCFLIFFVNSKNPFNKIKNEYNFFHYI